MDYDVTVLTGDWHDVDEPFVPLTVEQVNAGLRLLLMLKNGKSAIDDLMTIDDFKRWLTPTAGARMLLELVYLRQRLDNVVQDAMDRDL